MPGYLRVVPAPIYHTTIPSPLGDLLLTGDGRALTGVYLTPHRHGPAVGGDWVRDDAPFTEARRQLEEYFAGTRTVFDLTTAATGTPFQQRVWQALCAIPHGRTASYGDIARATGNAKAVRAVGLANGRNPLSIVVPCHRVIGSDGSLTGYGGGVERKQWLLAHEARHHG
ncbi:MAG: methylated-DNA--[protein]-cysteine S-methyltransferase [Gemmatimonadetes bacterium]|nr:methylated-DNA--[protein]-cysteine S-methyltransferase [Gemmatimonadota bacterium]